MIMGEITPKSALDNVCIEVVEEPSEKEELVQKKVLFNEYEGAFVFISIDLVNSTIFKTRYREFWPFVIQAFYNIISSALGAEDSYRSTDDVQYIGEKRDFDNEKMKTGGFKVWKLVGDEVLLYHEIVSIKELLNTIRIMNFVTKNIVELFIRKANEAYKSDMRKFKEFKQIAQRNLAAKTTMWAAQCGNEITIDCPNMFYDASNYMDSTDVTFDFLGPDIDAGFRMCKYAEKNKVIISPNLIALLLTQKDSAENSELWLDIKDHFRIVAYVELEDVWEKRYYPIFMYHPMPNDSEDKIKEWQSLFEYDEKETSNLTEFIFNDSAYFHTEKYCCTQLERIYKELGRSEEINNLIKCFLKQIEYLSGKKNTVQPVHHSFEFHISCACYNPKSRKVKIIKHATHGLSFGCVKVDINHGYWDLVKETYINKFDVEVVHVDENNFLSLYEANRTGNKEEILGFITLAEAKPIKGCSETQEQGWYSLTAIEKMAKNSQKINSFDKAIKKIKEIYSDE